MAQRHQDHPQAQMFTRKRTKPSVLFKLLLVEQKIRLIQAYQVNMVEQQKCLWHSRRKESREDYTVYMGRSKMAYFSSGIVASSVEVIGLHREQIFFYINVFLLC